MKRQRFSLGELTIILAIVTLFLTVITLTGPHYWTPGRYNTCSGPMKQLGNAAAIYAGDNLGNYPGPSPSATLPTWDVALGVQLGITAPVSTWSSGGITFRDKQELTNFICFADDEAYIQVSPRQFKVMFRGGRKSFLPMPAWGFTKTYELRHPLHRSYSLNLGDKEIAPTASSIPSNAMTVPSATILLCDLHDRDNLLTGTNLASLTQNEFISRIFEAKKVHYHSSSATTPRVNALFYDGHVEPLDEKEAWRSMCFKYNK